MMISTTVQSLYTITQVDALLLLKQDLLSVSAVSGYSLLYNNTVLKRLDFSSEFTVTDSNDNSNIDIDLSSYATTTAVNTLLSGYYNKTEIDNFISNVGGVAVNPTSETTTLKQLYESTNNWIKLLEITNPNGATLTSTNSVLTLDLNRFQTSSDVSILINNSLLSYTNTSSLNTLLSGKQATMSNPSGGINMLTGTTIKSLAFNTPRSSSE